MTNQKPSGLQTLKESLSVLKPKNALGIFKKTYASFKKSIPKILKFSLTTSTVVLLYIMLAAKAETGSFLISEGALDLLLNPQSLLAAMTLGGTVLIGLFVVKINKENKTKYLVRNNIDKIITLSITLLFLPILITPFLILLVILLPETICSILAAILIATLITLGKVFMYVTLEEKLHLINIKKLAIPALYLTIQIFLLSLLIPFPLTLLAGVGVGILTGTLKATISSMAFIPIIIFRYITVTTLSTHIVFSYYYFMYKQFRAKNPHLFAELND